MLNHVWPAIPSEDNLSRSFALWGRERDRARAWFVLRDSDCDDSHLVGALE